MSEQQASTPFIICKPEGDGINWPSFDTTEGRPAVMVFTTREKAKEFVKAKGMQGQYGVARMAQPEILRWLRHNLLNGTSLVGVDPGPDGGTAIDILRFIAEAETGK
jgi:hypothetical protein